MNRTAATALSDEMIHELRPRAAAEAGKFVDPRLLRRVETWWRRDLREWASAVVGESVPELRRLRWPQWVLLDLARDAEPSPGTLPVGELLGSP